MSRNPDRRRPRAALSVVRLEARDGPAATLPDLVGSPTPASNPALPAGFDLFAPPVDASTPAAATPDFGEWTKTAGPDRTLAIAGDEFSTFAGADAGKDTQFLTYGQTSAGNGALRPAAIQRLDGPLAAVTLDSASVPNSLYFVWAKNAAGVSRPVAVNKTESWWLGSDRPTRGSTVSVYGQNLKQLGAATPTSYLYVEPAAGGVGQWVSPTAVSDYKVDFTVPAGLASGEYRVWVHNGHGGKYGWAAPLTVAVRDAFPRSGVTFNVRDFGAVGDGVADDYRAIFNAQLAAEGTPGSTIFFPAGTYSVSRGFYTVANTTWAGAGKDSTFIKPSSAFDAATNPGAGNLVALLFGNASSVDVGFRDLTFDANGNLNSAVKNIAYLRQASDVTFTNVGMIADTPAGVGNNSGGSYSAFDIHLTRGVAFRGCDFVQSAPNFLGTSRQAVVEGCTFRAADDTGGLLLSWGSEFLRVSNNVVRDLDNTRPDGWGEGRFFITQGPWATNQNVYVGSNRTVNMAVRMQAANANTGEQFLLENGTPDFRGPATAGTPTTVTVPGVSVPFDPVEYKASAIVVSGKGVGQSRRVAAIDSATGVVTLQGSWNVVPDATSVVVVGRDTTQIAVVDNDIDGKADQVTQAENTASTGVMVWGMSHGVVVADNRITDVRVGVTVWPVSSGNPATGGATGYFDRITGNAVSNVRAGLGQTNDATPGTAPAARPSPSNLGTVIRDNVVNNAAVNAIGDEPRAGGRSIDLTVIEANSGVNMATGVVLDLFSKASGGNYVVRKNDFDRGTGALAGSHGVFVGSGVVPALRDNAFRNFAVPYLGLADRPVLEFPTRTVALGATAGGASATGVLPLWNSGTATLAWSVTSDAPWLAAAPPSGATGPDNGVTPLTLTANPAGLAPGTYTATVRATSGSTNTPFTSQVPTNPNASDGQPLELGTRLRVTQPGVATALRFFEAASETGPHTGSLWSPTGQLLARVTYAGETASGWQTATLSAPVALVPGPTTS